MPKLEYEDTTAIGEWWIAQLKRLFSWMFSASAWSGLWPSLVLGAIAWLALEKTNDQIMLLGEQNTYLREPVLNFVIRPHLSPKRRDDRYDIWTGNIGNDTAHSVQLRAKIFLVTDSQVFSCGIRPVSHQYSGRLDLTARQVITSRLDIPPDSQVAFGHHSWVMERYYLYGGSKPMEDSFPRSFLYPVHDTIQRRDFYALRKIFGGDYIVFFEATYYRHSDYKLMADTAFFEWDYTRGVGRKVHDIVGGPGRIERILQMMRFGPDRFVYVRMNKYVVALMGADNRDRIVGMFDRSTSAF